MCKQKCFPFLPLGQFPRPTIRTTSSNCWSSSGLHLLDKAKGKKEKRKQKSANKNIKKMNKNLALNCFNRKTFAPFYRCLVWKPEPIWTALPYTISKWILKPFPFPPLNSPFPFFWWRQNFSWWAWELALWFEVSYTSSTDSNIMTALQLSLNHLCWSHMEDQK